MATVTFVAPLVVVAYILFFAHDWLLVSRPSFVRSNLVFALAFLLVVVAAGFFLFSQIALCPWDTLSLISLVMALLFFALTIKSLFFSLPKGTYASPEQGRHVYTQGMYALCRHPGVLWYCLMFVAFALMLRTPESFACCALLCAGNVAYMVFQDCWSFPRTFCDYAGYKTTVPFFIPTPTSIRHALKPTKVGDC